MFGICEQNGDRSYYCYKLEVRLEKKKKIQIEVDYSTKVRNEKKILNMTKCTKKLNTFLSLKETSSSAIRNVKGHTGYTQLCIFPFSSIAAAGDEMLH